MTRLAALLAVALALAGCGLGAGGEDGDVTVTVSRDFGKTQLAPPVQGPARDETVMRLLERTFDGVQTRYGGGFVQGIDGLSGGRVNGKKVDWFYYVNGIEAETGAADRRVHPGDRVWWDHHAWEVAMRIPAVVGSFPEPFLDGSDGRRFPVRLVCLGDTGRSCQEVQARLGDAGVEGAAPSSLQNSIGKGVLRVVVGRWRDVRQDPAAAQLERGPSASGVFAQPAGNRLTLLDADGKPAREIGAGGGLVAATRLPDQQPTWIVTGIDDAGLAAAAAALNEGSLDNHFAVAIDAGLPIPLPYEP